MEKYANAVQTTLTAGISNTDTVINIADGTGFPTGPNFRVMIDSEIMLVTSGGSPVPLNWNVTRGVEGTTAAAHASGAKVVNIITAAMLDAIRADLIGAGTASGRPSGRTGNLYFNRDVTYLSRHNGVGYDDWRVFPTESEINLASFTWLNQGAATATQQGGAVWLLSDTNTGDNVYALIKSQPTLPASIIIDIMPAFHLQNYCGAGLVLYESSSGKVATWMIWCNASTPQNGLVYQNWLGAASPQAAPFIQDLRNSKTYVRKMKIRDDGTNFYCYVSYDAINFNLEFTYPRSAFMGGTNRWGFAVYNNNTTYKAGATFVGLSEPAG